MSFEEFLRESVDEGLSSLGESSKEAIYFHLEKNFKINKQDIPNRIEEFTDAIETIFGNGAKILEIQIMKCLYRKVGYTFKYHQRLNSLKFSKYVATAKIAQQKYNKINELQPNQKQNRKKDNMRSDTLNEPPKALNRVFKNLSGMVI